MQNTIIKIEHLAKQINIIVINNTDGLDTELLKESISQSILEVAQQAQVPNAENQQ